MRFVTVVLLLLSGVFLRAEPIAASLSYDDAFQAGKWEVSAGGAVFFSPFGATRNRPTHNYAVGVVNAGYMLSNLRELGWARGNFECLGELFGGPVFVGRGHYASGMTFWGRYNFVQPGWRFVPFGQLGMGLSATDIDQRIMGQVFQFNLNAAFGARFFLRSNLALIGEYRYQHISNANTGRNNLGLNAQGAFLGVSCLF